MNIVISDETDVSFKITWDPSTLLMLDLEEHQGVVTIATNMAEGNFF